jgi:hypothetical protein
LSSLREFPKATPRSIRELVRLRRTTVSDVVSRILVEQTAPTNEGEPILAVDDELGGAAA